MGARSLGLVACAALVLAATMVSTGARADRGDADERAHALAVAIAPNYVPWASPVFEPGESLETLYFQLQTVTGAVLFGTVLIIAGRRARRDASHASASHH